MPQMMPAWCTWSSMLHPAKQHREPPSKALHAESCSLQLPGMSAPKDCHECSADRLSASHTARHAMQSSNFELKIQQLPCRFYFAYCEAAFDAKYIHNYQITWKKDGLVQTPPAGQASSSGHSVTSMLVHGDRTRPADPVTQVRIVLRARQCVWDLVTAAHLLCQPASCPAAAEP